MHRPTITKLKSSFPKHVLTQDEFCDAFHHKWYSDVPNVRELMKQTRVEKRHMAWDPREALATRSPEIQERMAVYKTAVLDMARPSIAGVLEGAPVSDVGSFVMASCTGYFGPTPDLMIAKEFQLRADLRRTFIGHMGCFAAFNVLKVAMDALAARPGEPVLANCSETCSLHFRPERTREQAIIHALFGDASVSALISNEESGAGVQLIRSRTEQLYDTHDLMTWDILADGFYMTLSPFVPLIIAEQIRGFMERLLAPEKLAVSDIRHWIIHPGGPKIVRSIATQLRLTEDDVEPTFRVLRERGNCSSGTVLLVLEDVLQNRKPEPGDYGVMMAFGPGLTMESILVRF